MKITGAALSAIFMGMSTVFNKTFADVQTTYQKIAMTVPSSSAYVDYRWLANFSTEHNAVFSDRPDKETTPSWLMYFPLS